MSFNKRYINKDKILAYRDKLGILFGGKTDVIFLEDKFSIEIYDLFCEGKNQLIEDKISQEIN
jgi:hypothetical protein